MAITVTLTWNDEKRVQVPFLGPGEHRFSFGFRVPDEEGRRGAQQVVDRAMAAGPAVLTAAEPYLVQFCEETKALYANDGPIDVHLARPSDVWSHVSIGEKLRVKRRNAGDAEDGWYLSIECNCDWEVEHGLQLVFRDGIALSKVSMYDGRLTNSDGHGGSSHAGVVYVSIAAPNGR